MKLADVYFVENNGLGAWQQIGYNAPNGSNGAASTSTNFEYGKTTATATSGATWGAYNKVALNDCGVATEDIWTVTPTVTNGSVAWAAAVAGGDTGNCGILTPNFSRIGK